MKIHLEASAGTLELITALKTAPARLREVQRKEAFELAEALVNRAKTTYRNAKETTATATRVRTGHLRASYVHSPIKDTASGVTFEFGVLQAGAKGKALEYAAAHEFGATIKAKGGGYLAIPIGDWSNKSFGNFRAKTAMTERGVSRGSPSDFPAGVLFRIRNVLFRAVSRDEIMPMFALVKQVKIPARPALLPSVGDILPTWTERFTAALNKATTG